MHYAEDAPRVFGTVAIGTPLHFEWLRGIAKWILVLNLFDGVLTLIWVEFFWASEANPLMSDLVYNSALLFMAAKLTLVSLGTLFLWRYRSRPLAVMSLFLAFFSYYWVFLIHMEIGSKIFL